VSTRPGSVVPPPRPLARDANAVARAAASASFITAAFPPRAGVYVGANPPSEAVSAYTRPRLQRVRHDRCGRRRDAVVEGSRYSQIAGIDPERLDAFRAGIRKRYSDEQILTELRASAERLGRSPTMREFAADPETTVHPQTVIGHFGSWNAAKRRAGLVPRRFATREELLDRLRELGEELGRTPTARDLESRRGSMPSKSLYWHTFGSLTTALRDAGFDVPVGEERLARAIEQGVFLAIRSGRLPKFADWAEARRSDPSMLTEWQVYRMFEARRGAWSTFQFLVREALANQGVDVAPDGTLAAEK
jgi:hypothetical protein